MPQSKTTASGAHLESVRAQVNKRLESFYQLRIQQAHRRNPAEERLWQLLAQVTLAGGKRLRPYLVIWAYEAFGGSAHSKIIEAGIAWELLHQALLIHDDVIDRDYIRHGAPNIAGLLREHYAHLENHTDRDHYANSGAILAGDLALSSAHQLLINSGFPAERVLRACHILDDTTSAVIGGELLDTEAVMQPLLSTDALQIAELKTASYSFVGPLLTGATLAGANTATLSRLTKLGTTLGVAFQLSDDLLGLFGSSSVTGKSTTTDIHEGKRTLLLQHTLELATPEQRSVIEKTLGNPNATEAELKTFREIVTTTGARTKVEQLITRYLDEADSIVANLPLADATYQSYYHYLAAKLRNRKA